MAGYQGSSENREQKQMGEKGRGKRRNSLLVPVLALAFLIPLLSSQLRIFRTHRLTLRFGSERLSLFRAVAFELASGASLTAFSSAIMRM